MDIQEIKDPWNYFYSYDNKSCQRSIEKNKKKKKGSTFCSLVAWVRADKPLELGSQALVCFLLPGGFQNTIVGLTDYVSREQEYQDWLGLGQKKTVL